MHWPTRCSPGAVGLGDLGRHFPDTDPVWEGADSVTLLTEVVAMAAGQGFTCANADCTVVADAPRLAPYTPAMVERLGAVLGARVSVKATRAEGLGALGRAEGIACLAVVLMESAWFSPAARAPRGTASGAVARRRGALRSGGRKRRRSEEAASRSAGEGRRARQAADRRPGPRSELGGDQVEGRRAVLELLTVGRRTVRRILLAEDQDPSPQLDRIEELAARMRVPVETVPRARLDSQARTESPQGVLALARPLEPVALEDLAAPDRRGHGTVPSWWQPVSPTPATSVPSSGAPSAPA